eukprot:TRINITY_DN87678_c0_g1_i1.p1 TRINITY_DN87678_c0_g1~~TRINITY_DN87678_c0_g1_i1.p1  ORF type:complete len:363 (+),score=75.59 TRINITY_DN87678_c0_g1_i1:47-1090(+)
MKLKRFLLRYDPPGVGLEVESGEVQHKNLPKQEDIHSREDVKSVVDQLIESEPTLLTRKRHRSALIQLLGRLYQVDVEAEEDDGPGRGSDDDGGSPMAASNTGDIQEGQMMVVTGLTGKLQVHNGECVTITKARADKHKYEAELLHSREAIKVKGAEHFLRINTEATLAVGVHVVIRGLRNHIELNGCGARVEECHEESQRYEVRAIESGQLFRVKKENLVLIHLPPGMAAAYSMAAKENQEPNANNPPRKKEGGLPAASNNVGEAQLHPGGDAGDGMLEVGSTVELAGLKTAQAYNGQQAEVLSVDRVRSRYEIRLGDGSVKTIRAENVRLLGGKSPRTKRPKDKS